MSGLGRLIAEQQLRFDAAMRAAQSAWDNMAPPEPGDDDRLTEAEALKLARTETLATPALVADLLAKLADPEWSPNSEPRERPGWTVHDVPALERSLADCASVERMQTHELVALLMLGDDDSAMQALREWRERAARELASDIKARADELLDAQAKRDAEIDHYQEAA